NIEEDEKPKEEEDEKNKGDIDVYRMENDPSVKNPKSEFVVSQTLPAAAARLGLFNEEGLESTGEDFLKLKYSVASYPTDDLKELLPGVLPDMDFSCPKPTNQIQFSTFLSSVDNYFKEYSDEDVKFMKAKNIMPPDLQADKTYDPDVTPYVIPKLGPLYSHVWLKEDDNQNIGGTSPPSLSDPSVILPRKSGSFITDGALETEEVSCGPLLSRLLSAVFKGETEMDDIQQEASNNTEVNIKIEGNTAASTPGQSKMDGLMEEIPTVEPQQKDETPGSVLDSAVTEEMEELKKSLSRVPEGVLPIQSGWKANDVSLDYPTFEERLKRELKYVGIYINLPKDENNPNGDDPDWLTGREDDEISAELRELQNSLKIVTKKNDKRKHIIGPLLERYLAWQEYMSILDDLDKQIDQAYIKRIRVPKKKKKHHHGSLSSNVGSASQVAQQKAANSSLKALLDKRQRWINKIGPLFDKPEGMKRIPKESIFRDIDQPEDEDEDADVFGQTNTNKDDELTET
ncbi:hypothetical protein Kpol_1030p11, partial [Vanderwaltozyma polyspora DSM 70294]